MIIPGPHADDQQRLIDALGGGPAGNFAVTLRRVLAE